jgi:site-specific recombinase XerD
MLVRFEPKSEKLRRFLIGPLGPHIEGFATLLSQQGYSPAIGRRKIWLLADLSRWLERRRIRLKCLEERHIDAFLKERWKRVSKRRGEATTIIALLQYLRASHIIRTPAPAPPNDIGLVEQEYKSFLTQERALAQNSVNLYLRIARRFVSHHFQGGKLRLNTLVAKDVIDFVLYVTTQRGRWSAKSMTTALRSFLGFLLQQGRTITNLAAAVPTVSGLHQSELPRFLEAHQTEKVLRRCDRRTKTGKRDYAILLLLARLGLRGGEVAKLALDDIDWRAGELLIRGKGARMDKLPLLQDVGRALADYLQKARPHCSSRQVFIRSQAPYAGVRGASTVGSIVLRALARAQVHSPHRGAHVFRHSLATKMLGHGASLVQIGQVLRHQSVQTTEIYAKVDLIALRRLALPWQGGAL